MNSRKVVRIERIGQDVQDKDLEATNTASECHATVLESPEN